MKNCELCQKEHDGSYASGRFCCSRCARSFTTYAKRLEINQKVSNTLLSRAGPWFLPSDEAIIEAVPRASSIRNLIKILGFRYSGHRATKFKEKVIELKLDTTHFFKIRSFAEIFSYNEKKPHLATWLIKAGRKYQCEICGQDKLWQGKKITLHVDHINGSKNDHRFENLRFLCPNCHAQTPTYSWKNVRRLRKCSQLEQLEAQDPLKVRVDGSSPSLGPKF